MNLPRQPFLLLTLITLALGTNSCQVAKQGAFAKKKAGNSLLAQDEWRKGYRKADQRFAAKPNWNKAPNVPRADMKFARTSYSSVDVDGRYIAMTFDDGPHPTNTPRLLDMMKARNIKATFFVVGRNSKAYPSILRRMAAEGHEIANHTWSHPDLTRLSRTALRKEMDTSRDAIIAATGSAPRCYRPPYGAINSSVKTFIKSEYGYPTILWSVDPMDWKRPGASVVTQRLVSGTRNGGILLAHDIHKPTIDAMPATFDKLLAKGYSFVTVSQLIQLGQRKAAKNAKAKSSAPGADGRLAKNG